MERPLRCNVGAYYEAFLRERMSRDVYDHMNTEACRQLKRKHNDVDL